MTCPDCGRENHDGWPENRCQMCWESHIDDQWWEAVVQIEAQSEDCGC